MKFKLNCTLDVTRGKIPARYYVCVLSFIGLTVNYIMRFAISIALTEMVKPIPTIMDPHGCSTAPPDKNAAKTEEPKNLVEWDETEQGIMLSSFFWGYTATQVPGGIIADFFGPRRVLVISALFTSVFTVLSPTCAHWNLWALVACRICLGLAQGCFYASLHTVVALWVPSQERGLWGTVVFSGAHAGNFLQTLCTGFMLDAFRPHWEYVFYIWGSIGIVWVVIYFFTIYDNYQEVPRLSDKEREIMDAYYEKVSKKNRVVATPWKKILLNKAVWAAMIAVSGHAWGVFVMAVDIPKFMKSYLKFNVKANGFYLSMGYLSMIILAYASGKFVDIIEKKKWLSRTWNRKIFTTIAIVGPSLGFIGVSYAACNRTMAIASLVVGFMTMGTFYPSLKVNPIDLTPNHAGTVGALCVTCAGLSGIAVPYVIGVMTPQSTWYQWNQVFWLTFGFRMLTAVVYLIWASGELQSFNSEGFAKTEEEKKPEEK